MKTLQLTCIRCPIGCQLDVTLENDIVTKVQGNECRLGQIYAEKESVNPTRVVTTTIPLINGSLPMLAVKTSVDIPKKDVFLFMNALGGITAEAPIKMGTIVAKNIAGTGADLVATRTIPRK